MRDFVFRDIGNERFRVYIIWECTISCLETLGMRDFVFRDFGNARFRV